MKRPVDTVALAEHIDKIVSNGINTVLGTATVHGKAKSHGGGMVGRMRRLPRA